MLEHSDDFELLKLVNSLIEKNLVKQQIVKEQNAKANSLYNAIIYQSNSIERFKHDLRTSDGQTSESIYFEKHSKGTTKGCIYYRLLAKATENLREGLESPKSAWTPKSEDNEQESSLAYEIRHRINKASNILTAEMTEYSDISSGTAYKKRQRHQLSQKFKSK